MSRFGTESSGEIDKMVETITPNNTKKSKQSVWAQFAEFCQERNYNVNVLSSKEELAQILKDWAGNMKKQNGDDYKESVIKIMWNSTAKQLQEKYYQNFNIKFDPFSDVEFACARQARDAKRRVLQANPNKRKMSSIALDNEELSKIIGLWNEDTPEGLQRKLFHVISYELAWRGGEGSSALIHNFCEERDHTGLLTGRIEYNPIFTKTCQGGSKKISDSKWLATNKENPDVCPVRLFRKFLGKRTNFIKTDRLFVTPNPSWQNPTSKGWYKNSPVGKNQMSTWMSEAATKVGIDTTRCKVTNHSVRASAVSNLAKQGVGEQQVIKITGHSNTHSLKPYIQMDEQHHSRIVGQMRGQTVSADMVSSTSMQSTSNSTASATNIYNNCVFNFKS